MITENQEKKEIKGKKKVKKFGPALTILFAFLSISFVVVFEVFFSKLTSKLTSRSQSVKKEENSGLSDFTKKKPFSEPSLSTIQLGSHFFKTEIVSTPEARYQGLSGRSSLAPKSAMLFNFSNSQIRKFVMRDMNFPLDIIFLNQEKIIKIAANLPPAGHNPQIIYSSDNPANQVLEINGGECQKLGIKLGTKLKIIKN